MRMFLIALVGLSSATTAGAQDRDAMIADALSAAPPSVAEGARVMTMDGTVLREGDNGFTCLPQTATTGPMCNDDVWMAAMKAVMAKAPFSTDRIGLSYMLAGEGDAPGVSNIDPYASEPTPENDWIKEGPHLMLILPDRAALEGLSTNPDDPVYVMWKDTPYAHVMIRIAEEDHQGAMAHARQGDEAPEPE